MRHLTRRHWLAGMAAVLAPSVLAAAATPTGAGRGRSHAPAGGAQRDLTDPLQSFEAFVALRGSLSDEYVYDRVVGQVYGVREGEAPRLLFASEGLQVSRYRRESAKSFRLDYNYLGWFKDAGTGRRLETFRNPYTARELAVPLSAHGGPGTVLLTAPTTPRAWQSLGDLVLTQDDGIAASFPTGLPKADWARFSGSRREVLDPAVTRAHGQLSFVGIERWREWMQMADEPGILLWHVTGVKLDGRADLPPDVQAVALGHDPRFFERF